MPEKIRIPKNPLCNKGKYVDDVSVTKDAYLPTSTPLNPIPNNCDKNQQI